jgi:glycerate kinase
MPLADGGDGTIDVVKHYLKADIVKLTVNNPIFKPVEASYLFSKDTKIAYIEMAEASGLKLLKENEKNCTSATSYGTGELIVDALKKGAKEIILGIGGSATNDAGMGMATALGFAFLDENDSPLLPIGSNLIKVEKIDTAKVDPKLKNVKVKIACDVTNPFYGNNGAAHIYAEQKGASKEDIALLDNGLKKFAKILNNQYNVNVQKIVGSGAAGGIGGGASVFLNATLTSGIELIKEMVGFDTKIENADWIITGEGKLDGQTLSGKTINGVLSSAKEKNIPVAALCGWVDLSIDDQNKLGLHYTTSILWGLSNLEEAIQNSYQNLIKSAYNYANLLKVNSI